MPARRVRLQGDCYPGSSSHLVPQTALRGSSGRKNEAEMAYSTPTASSFVLGAVVVVVGIIVPLTVMIVKNKKVFARQE